MKPEKFEILLATTKPYIPEPEKEPSEIVQKPNLESLATETVPYMPGFDVLLFPDLDETRRLVIAAAKQNKSLELIAYLEEGKVAMVVTPSTSEPRNEQLGDLVNAMRADAIRMRTPFENTSSN